MEKRGRRKKTISEELDEIIEMKRNESSALKKIADSLKNYQISDIKNIDGK